MAEGEKMDRSVIGVRMDMDADADVDADVNVDGGVDVDVDADLDLDAGAHANYAENPGDLAWCAEKERTTCSLNSHLQRHDVGPWVHTRDDCVADAELHVFIQRVHVGESFDRPRYVLALRNAERDLPLAA